MPPIRPRSPGTHLAGVVIAAALAAPLTATLAGTSSALVVHADAPTPAQPQAPAQPPTPAQPPAPAHPPAAAPPQPPAPIACTINLAAPRQMRDVVSNVLLRAFSKPDAAVRAFLDKAQTRFTTGDDLRNAAADHFGIDQKHFAELVERWRHINCKHAAVPGYVTPDAVLAEATGPALSPMPFSAFAADVTLHVVLHEMGHAVIREFDLMVLGNEETMADAFATHFLIHHLPDRAPAAIAARVRSLMLEAGEVPREQWTVKGEHDNDARRAYQITALAIAADRSTYAPLAELVGMSDRDITRARDYGADIHRAWRRTLAPLLMPTGVPSTEARLRADDATSEFVHTGESSLAAGIQTALSRIDWHSQVTVNFVGGAGGAAWNRSSRTINVNGEYLRRFIAQGVRLATESPSTPTLPSAP